MKYKFTEFTAVNYKYALQVPTSESPKAEEQRRSPSPEMMGQALPKIVEETVGSLVDNRKEESHVTDNVFQSVDDTFDATMSPIDSTTSKFFPPSNEWESKWDTHGKHKLHVKKI